MQSWTGSRRDPVCSCWQPPTGRMCWTRRSCAQGGCLARCCLCLRSVHLCCGPVIIAGRQGSLRPKLCAPDLCKPLALLCPSLLPARAREHTSAPHRCLLIHLCCRWLCPCLMRRRGRPSWVSTCGVCRLLRNTTATWHARRLPRSLQVGALFLLRPWEDGTWGELSCFHCKRWLAVTADSQYVRSYDPSTLCTLFLPCAGFSGAELANVVNEAAFLAARNGSEAVGLPELVEAVQRTR